MALSKASFQSFYQGIHDFWYSERSSLRCTEKELTRVLLSAALRLTNLDINEARVSLLFKSEIYDLVNSWIKVISEEELPWLFMYALQESDGINPIITGFDDTLMHHLSSKKRIDVLRCSFISPRLIEFAQDHEIKLFPVIDQLVYYTKEDIIEQLIPAYHLMLPSDWAPNRKGVVLSSIYGCDEISVEAGSFICQNGDYILFDTEEYHNGTLMSDLSDGWHMIVPYGNVFSRNISTIRHYFSNGCLRPIEPDTCLKGQKELFLSWYDFRSATACDYQIDTNENNMRAARKGDRFLDQPAIIVNLYNLEVYVHSSRLVLGIPEDIYERSVILVPDYVNSMFCRNSLLQTANDLNSIFSKRDDGFEGFTKHYRKYWIEKARTGRYDMDDPIVSIESFIDSPDKKMEFETLMLMLAKMPIKAHRGLDRECADIRFKIQEEYGITPPPPNNDELSILNEAWALFWTLDPQKLQKGSEKYNSRKDQLPSFIVKERLLRGEWLKDIDPIADLAPFINKEKHERDEFINLMHNIQRVYKEHSKTKPSDRVRIMKAVDKHFGICYDKDKSPAGKAFSIDKNWENYHRQMWTAFWGMNKEDDTLTNASDKELSFEYLKERINSGEWIV